MSLRKNEPLSVIVLSGEFRREITVELFDAAAVRKLFVSSHPV
jgi:hypothetical protein